MHSLLEDYLTKVTARLTALPLAHRDEEVRELREHLRNAFAANRAQGQTEDAAALYAMRDFGAPEILGVEVVSAWRRGERREGLRSFWGAAVSAVMLSFLLPHLINPLIYASLQHLNAGHWPSWAYVMVWIWFIGVPVLVGAMSGLAFPKRAAIGTALAVTACSGYSLISLNLFVSHRHLVMAPNFMVLRTLMSGAACALSIFAAWACSRWRERDRRRLRA